MQVTKNVKIKNTVIILMLEICTFMGMFLTTARSVILGTLLTELNGYQFYSITVIITSMMMAAVGPIAGKLSDIFGRKIFSMAGIICYGAAAFVCGSAGNVYVFIAGIVFIGIGYGLMSSVTGAIICDTFEESVRPKYNSYINIASAAASLAGPVLGGIFADSAGWRYVYFFIIPISVVALVLSFLFLDSKKRTTKGKFTFDYLGVVALVLFVIPILFALSVGGSMFKWDSYVIIGCFGVAIIMLIALAFIEKKSKEPLIPYKLVKNRAYLMCLVLSFLAWFAFAVMNYVTVFYQDVLGVSKTVSGVLVLPRQIAQIITSFAVGFLLVKTKRSKLSGFLAFVIYAVGMFLMSLFVKGTPIFMVFIAEICFGIGISAQGIVLNSFVQNTLNRENTGTGLAFYNFLSSLASASGAAIGGCIINQISSEAAGLKMTFFVYFVFIFVGIIIIACSRWKNNEHFVQNK